MARIPFNDDSQVANPRAGQPRQDLVFEMLRDRSVESGGAGSYLESDHVGGAIPPRYAARAATNPDGSKGNAMAEDTGAILPRKRFIGQIVRNPE